MFLFHGRWTSTTSSSQLIGRWSLFILSAVWLNEKTCLFQYTTLKFVVLPSVRCEKFEKFRHRPAKSGTCGCRKNRFDVVSGGLLLQTIARDGHYKLSASFKTWSWSLPNSWRHRAKGCSNRTSFCIVLPWRWPSCDLGLSASWWWQL